MSMVRTEGQTICSRARYLLRNTRSLVLPIFVEDTTVILEDRMWSLTTLSDQWFAWNSIVLRRPIPIYTAVVLTSAKTLNLSNDLVRGSSVPFRGLTCRQSSTNNVRTGNIKQWAPEKGYSLNSPSDWTTSRIGELVVLQNSGENSSTILGDSVIIDSSPWSINWEFSNLNLPFLGVIFTTSLPSNIETLLLRIASIFEEDSKCFPVR